MFMLEHQPYIFLDDSCWQLPLIIVYSTLLLHPDPAVLAGATAWHECMTCLVNPWDI